MNKRTGKVGLASLVRVGIPTFEGALVDFVAFFAWQRTVADLRDAREKAISSN
jgi:hypothetical protein